MPEVTSASLPPLAPPRDVTSLLPLHLIKSETIPPAPTRHDSGSEPAVDFLIDFAGQSWIAYGASSLLVISHFPNPSMDAETKIGPTYRQVLELSRDVSVHVSAVSWSPARPSVAELAAALDNLIIVFAYCQDETYSSSFCWRQRAELVQSMKVNAIKWTDSGDGIISGGVEVVMWKRKDESWEIAWKFKPEVPQTLVSTTWSAHGLSATAPGSKLQIGVSYSPTSKASRCVLVCHGGEKSMYPQCELHHPMPVRMIQWRPSIGKPSRTCGRHALRAVLLTCCLDGAVRLWSEIDDGRIRRTGKDNSDHKLGKTSFCVVAVIEVNQTLDGFLGADIIVSWATEVEGVTIIDNEARYFSALDDLQFDTAGICEWLIGFGPKRVTTLWAVHCLDDFAPLRFPRVTMWKKEELLSSEVEASPLLVHKTFMMRNQASGPPIVCSLVQLLPCNTFAWTQLYSQASTGVEGKCANKVDNDSPLTSYSIAKLDADGHSGKISQFAIHPLSFEAELAASLDRKGMLHFWSCTSFFNSHIGLPASTPSWKLCGKASISDQSPNYTCMSWAPLVLGKTRVLLMGHADGIDCFNVETMKNDDEQILFHYMFSVPFRIKGHEQVLSRIFSVPLHSKCNGNVISSKFLLIALLLDEFQALSWEITIHCHDLHVNCGYEHSQTYQCDLSSKSYSVSVDPCSSVFPSPHTEDKIGSFAVVSCLNDSVLSVEKKLSFDDGKGGNCYAYHLVTGSVDGNLKLWRSMPFQSSTMNWHLVGMFTAAEGPIISVSVSACYRKIATASTTRKRNYSSTLRIWDSGYAQNAGVFMLENESGFDGDIVDLSWLALGNGQLLLGVCFQNEVRVFAPTRCGSQDVLKYEKTPAGNAWICIAVNSTLPAISDFHWGPRGTIVVVHAEYFSILSHCLLLADKKFLTEYSLSLFRSNSLVCNDTFIKNINPSTSDAPDKPTLKFIQSLVTTEMNVKDGPKASQNAASDQLTSNLVNKISFCSMSEIAENIGGSLPLFHPEALFVDLYSGNLKRAFVALRHLVKYIASNNLTMRGSVIVSSNMISLPPLSDYFEGVLLPSSSDRKIQWSSSLSQTGNSQHDLIGGSDAPANAWTQPSSKSEFSDFTEAFERLYDSAYITLAEKLQSLALIGLLQEIGNPHSVSAYGSLDEPGRRFWVAMRYQQLHFTQRFNRLPQIEELVASSELIGWAFQSDCHDNLFNSLLPPEASWEQMRNMGVGFWYANTTELRVKMERLARQRYVKTKDPKACTLLYIALNRLQVLAGLFKISKDDKDKPLAGFLSRNFQDNKNKAAALKNAYVLLGKHQLELAVAFFLLGGDASSAVMVCAKNLGDEQLALVICRLVEGYGGPLEHNLISKVILPSAVLKGDCWMASFLEVGSQWVLGNYLHSYLRMLGVGMGSELDNSVLSSFHASFLDPSIGQYCLQLATRNSMKNAAGEQNAAVLCRLAALMSVTSFSRCGLPLEALECLSSPLCPFGDPTRGDVVHGPNCNILEEILRPSGSKMPSNWMSDEVSSHVVSNSKLCLAVQYMANLLREHPSCKNIDMRPSGPFVNHETDCKRLVQLLKEFQENLTAALEYYRKRFSLIPLHLIGMIALSSFQNGLELVGHHILYQYLPEFHMDSRSDYLPLCPSHLLKATEEVSCLFVKYVTAACKDLPYLPYQIRKRFVGEGRFSWLAAWSFSNKGIAWSFRCLRAMLQLFLISDSRESLKLLSSILDLFEYLILFSSAWLQRNSRALLLTIRPIFVTMMNGNAAYEIIVEDLNKLCGEIMKMLACALPCIEPGLHLENDNRRKLEQDGVCMPEEKSWQLIYVSLWVHMSKFLELQLNKFSEVSDVRCSYSDPVILDPNENNLQPQVGLVRSALVELLKLTSKDISFYCSKHIVTHMLQEVTLATGIEAFQFDDDQSRSRSQNFCKIIERVKLLDNNDMVAFEQLQHVCADPTIAHGALQQEYNNWLPYFKKSSSGWTDAYGNITREFQYEETCDREDTLGSPVKTTGSPLACLSPDDHPFKSSGIGDLHDSKRVIPFHNPKEIYKRNGELLEALCLNSTNQFQAGLASNRKGIIFFEWEDDVTQRDKSAYIWGQADWPHNGWAGSECIPVPTCVSPGVGLGRKKVGHLGLGGATIGAGALRRQGKDLNGGGAFAFPVYAGTGEHGLGWGIQEGFDECVDPPATLDNVRTRAFASHPSRPFFLVGSSNTHIYLWEFGKDIATATYGVLPAANVPPPYALASVSAVRFDRCGHRFVTAAADGTVCTWQLEVGGRSNIQPTESSVCFNNHTSDVTYVTASGSIVAAAGYSTNGVNVVIWDTLAPPSTSQASIMCHEGGARSLAVFDNDIGSGSISPFILTGGKGGDVGLHDFRYIATGKTKRQKHLETGDHNIGASSSVDMRGKTGDENRNGMLWYIPKAHSGSVTKISTIPNTSFFLTGSKDGDVKLWDAKKAKLVFHWPRLHERHTFLQPSSRGFGGVVRAAVTDIQVVSHGFLTCGGDGLVKFVGFRDFPLPRES